MASSMRKENRCNSGDEDTTAVSRVNGDAKRQPKETGDRLQREHFLKPDSDQIDLNLLLDAVLDINDKLKTQEQDTSSCGGKYPVDCESVCTSRSSKKTFKSAQETPRRSETRQNYSFRNDEVLAIDIENQRLLREISRPRPRSAISTRDRKLRSTVNEPIRILTSSEVNRKRFQRRIDEENQALLRRLEAVKPTKTLNREHLLRTQTQGGKKNRSRPSSACSSSGRLSSRSLVPQHYFNQQDDGSLHSRKSSTSKRFSKPSWEAGW